MRRLSTSFRKCRWRTLRNFRIGWIRYRVNSPALNNKVANNYGAASGAARSASQIGNATGQADFNSGADSAQTLRVSANLKRNGNELSYNSGAADANTLRAALASGHGLATEAKQMH